MIKMMRRIITKTVVFLILAAIVPEIVILTWVDALLATILLGVLTLLVGFPLKILSLPLRLLTLGLFNLVINAFILYLVDALLAGVTFGGFGTMMFIAAIFSVVEAIFKKQES